MQASSWTPIIGAPFNFSTPIPIGMNNESGFNLTGSGLNLLTTTTPSTLEVISNEIKDYFDTHREQIPLLVIVYLLTIIWILYLILYHSRIQGIILSYLLRRFYFKDTAQFKFDSFSISFISGAIMFRNLHYSTGSYFVFVKDGCLVFRYWSRPNKGTTTTTTPNNNKDKPKIRLKIKLYHLDIQVFSPIRTQSPPDTFNSSSGTPDDLQQRGSVNGFSVKGDDTQSVNTVKSSEDGLFMKRLRSLFPAVEIKIDHGRISAGHDTLPYGLLVRFSTINSTFTTVSPSKYAPQIDLLTLVYALTYRNLRVILYPIRAYKGNQREIPPPLITSKTADSGFFQIFECSEGELEYEQDVPGKMIEPLDNGEPLPDLAWEIRAKCNKEAKIAYGPWADRQREFLWQYFLPTMFEDLTVTPEPSVGQTRIFKTVRFKLSLNCPTIFDLYFMNKMKLLQLHAELPSKGSQFEAILPFSTNPDGFDSYLTLNLMQPNVRTNLAFTPFLQADKADINVHIHYPRIWNSLQDWHLDIDAQKPQIYFIFEHKNFFQALINDWSSSTPPDIYSFTPFIYNITVRADHVELLVPCNQGNWIDCGNSTDRQQPLENNYISICAKSILLKYPIPFLEFCPTATWMDITVEINDLLARLIIPENSRMYYILQGIDAHKRFHTPNGVKSRLSLADEFDKRDGSFDCGEVRNIKIAVQFLLHAAPPIDMNRTDLLYVQHVKSMGNRQTFHPSKLDYDICNLELEIGPTNLFIYGLFLKKLWWVKENLFGWDQMFHDIREPQLIREKKMDFHDDPLFGMIDETREFDARYFRPLKVTVRVAIHNMTGHILHHTDTDPCPIVFCERICFEMTTDLDETRLQVFFLPINVYLEDNIVRNKSDQHLSTGNAQLSGLVIRGHAMLSHEGLPPERETLEYAWQMEIILGKISTRLTLIQMEKLGGFLKNFYLQIMEDEYTLLRSPVMDKAKWIEKLKYDVLRFSLDSVDLSLVEVGNAVNVQVAPVRLCMCNMHTSSCNEGLTLKVGIIQIRQLLRLHPGSWLEAGSIHVPELRINAKFECHPPTPASMAQQLEFLRLHDQRSQRLHFLYIPTTTTTTGKRPSTVGLPMTSMNIQPCACLGGSSSYYTLVQGEQFFKNSFRLSEQSTFGRSLFRPDLHVIYSHPIFEHKHEWGSYEHQTNISPSQLIDEEILYPFDFCGQSLVQQSSSEQQEHDDINNSFRHSVPSNLFSLSRTNSGRGIKSKPIIDKEHKRSSSSIPISHVASGSSVTTTSDVYLSPSEQPSSTNSSRSSLNSTLNKTQHIESPSISSLTMMQHLSSATSTPSNSNWNLALKLNDGGGTTGSSKQDLTSKSSRSSSSSDSLTALEEILERQQTGNGASLPIQKNLPSSIEPNLFPAPSLPGASWINLRNQMKMPIPNSTLLSTTYIRYLSHYRSSTWSNVASYPPPIQHDHIDGRPILDFDCVSQGFLVHFWLNHLIQINRLQRHHLDHNNCHLLDLVYRWLHRHHLSFHHRF